MLESGQEETIIEYITASSYESEEQAEKRTIEIIASITSCSDEDAARHLEDLKRGRIKLEMISPSDGVLRSGTPIPELRWEWVDLAQ